MLHLNTVGSHPFCEAFAHIRMSVAINKLPGGWIHSDAVITKEGATYAVRVSQVYANVCPDCFNLWIFL